MGRVRGCGAVEPNDPCPSPESPPTRLGDVCDSAEGLRHGEGWWRRAEPANGPRPPEYGLIAEEVAEIYPELVVRDADGQPTGVRYHVLPAMLLNELQRQQRQLDAQASRLIEQAEHLRDQTRLIDELTARLSRLEAKGAAAGH